MNFSFGSADIIITYNHYVELRNDLSTIAEAIQQLNIAERYKVTINQQPATIAGATPVVAIDFIRQIDTKNDSFGEAFMRLYIDEKTMRLQIIERGQLSDRLYQQVLSELIDNFIKIWKAFDKIAQRNIIERVGLISFAFTQEKSEPNIFKDDIDYDFYMLRLIKNVEQSEIKYFGNTNIIKNLILEPDFMSGTEVRAINLINDIAMPPSSKGVIDKNALADGLKYIADLSIENLKANLKWIAH